MRYKRLSKSSKPKVTIERRHSTFYHSICVINRRILMIIRPYVVCTLVVLSFIFVVLNSKGSTKPIPWEMTDFVVAKESHRMLLDTQQTPPELQPHLSAPVRIPIVLFWHKYFVEQFDQLIPKNSDIDCPYRCTYTADHKLGADATVRVFHERNFDPTDLPASNPRAFNVYFTLEPPFFTFSDFERKGKFPVDYFNVTTSYRSKSSIYYPYDRLIKRNGNETIDEIWTDEQVKAKIEAKHKPLIIAVSNCFAHSSRQKYVRELTRYLNVTILGGCLGTNNHCAKDFKLEAIHPDTQCMEKLNAEHFFHLSFENSVCPEYQSEKFWRVKQLIVPIVLSRAAMSPHIPKSSYIAASDFEAPSHLARHLKMLMGNRTEYAKYFEWTKHFRKTRLSESKRRVACQLCKLAHSNVPIRINDIKRYWTTDECPRNYAIDLINNPRKVKKLESRLTKIMRKTYRDRNIEKIL